MEGKSSSLTGEVSHFTVKARSDVRMMWEKSAEAIVVMTTGESQ